MPGRAAQERIELPGFPGGLNRESDEFLVAPDETPDCLNVDFGLRGEVSKRDGYTQQLNYAKVASQMYRWSNLGGAEYWIIGTEDGVLAYSSGAAPTAVVTYAAESEARNYPFAFTSMNDKVYATTLRNGAVDPQSFDGTTWSNVTPTDFDGTSSTFPYARHLVDAHERVFAFNVEDSTGTDYRSRMYWSEAGDPETWEALSFIDFEPDNGQDIQAAILFGESIVVFKNRSIFLLSGVDENTFTVYPLDSAIGTECAGTVASSGQDMVFLDHRSGVWKFDGASFQRIDDKIRTYILDGINVGAHHRSAGFVYRGKYYLSVPWGTDDTPSRTFVYDGVGETWTEYDFGFTSAVELAALPYMGGVRHTSDANPANHVYRMMNGTDDNGTDIAAHFLTSWLAPKEISAKSRIRRADMAFSATGDYDLTVEMYRDFLNDPYRTQTINVDPGGAIYGTAVYGTDAYGAGASQVLIRGGGWGQRWDVCQFKVSDDASSAWQLNKFAFTISSLPRRRGA